MDSYLLWSTKAALEHYEALLAKMPELPYGFAMINGLLLADAVSKTNDVDRPEEVMIRTYERRLAELKNDVDRRESLIRQYEHRLTMLKSGASSGNIAF